MADDVQRILMEFASDAKGVIADLKQMQIGANDFATAIRNQKLAMSDTEKELRRAVSAQKEYTDPKDQQFYNEKIQKTNELLNQQKAEMDKLKGGMKDVTKEAEKTGGAMQELGKKIMAAFAVVELAKFAKESFKLAEDREKSERQLLAATKGRIDIQKELLKQGEEISKQVFVSPTAITDIQKLALAQGLTVEQTKKVTAAAFDFAAVTGKDVQEAARGLILTYAGTTREVLRYDPAIRSLTKAQLANGEAVDILAKKYTGIAAAGVTFSQKIAYMKDEFMVGFGQAFQDLLPKLDGVNIDFKELGKTVNELANIGVKPLIQAFFDLFKSIGQLFGSKSSALSFFTFIGQAANLPLMLITKMVEGLKSVADFFNKNKHDTPVEFIADPEKRLKATIDALIKINQQKYLLTQKELSETDEALEKFKEKEAEKNKIDAKALKEQQDAEIKALEESQKLQKEKFISAGFAADQLRDLEENQAKDLALLKYKYGQITKTILDATFLEEENKTKEHYAKLAKEQEKALADKAEADDEALAAGLDAAKKAEKERLKIQEDAAKERAAAKKKADKEVEDSQKKILSKVMKAFDAAEQIQQATFKGISTIYQANIDLIDSQITTQERRVQEAKAMADKGFSAIYIEEKKRMDDMMKEKEKEAKKMRELATIEIIANAGVAVAKTAAKWEWPYSLIAIAGTVIGLGAGLLAAKQQVASSGYKKGGYTGDGNPNEIAGPAHKREFIFDETDTAQNKEYFEMIHKKKINLADLFNTRRKDFDLNKTVMIMNGLSNGQDISKRLERIETAILGQPGTELRLDEHGLTARVTTLISNNKKILRAAK